MPLVWHEEYNSYMWHRPLPRSYYKHRAEKSALKVIELSKQLTELKKQTKKEIAANNLAIAKKEKELKEYKQKIDKQLADQTKRYSKNLRAYRNVRYQNKKNVTKRLALQKEIETITAEDTTPDNKYLELICRTIVAYDKLIKDNTITFNEISILLTAGQREYFDMEDLKDRYGVLPRIKADMKCMVEADYIKKVERKQLWYATEAGRTRLADIIEHIRGQKQQAYKVKIFKKHVNK